MLGSCKSNSLDAIFFIVISWMNDDMVNSLTPHLIGKRPNTYTFTKSLAEHVLLQEADNIPIAIFRPSIIGAAWKEPLEVSCVMLFCYPPNKNFCQVLALHANTHYFVLVI